MLRTGLVSITFRKLSPREIVDLVARAGLQAVEWGGDVHCPPGQIERAREVAAMTGEAGLSVASYGSYYRVGHEEKTPFEFVLESARALGAPLIRVWAGDRGSDKADDAYRERIARESRRIADWAADVGVAVAYEFHGNTLTDTTESAVRLLRDVDHPNVGAYWQPPQRPTVEQCLASLRALTPWLRNLHAFHWRFEPRRERRPLAEGREAWSRYLAEAAATGRDHYVMLEFVADDSPEAFVRDAATLKSWLGEVNDEA